ncbi:MAG TPA: type II secretion system protein GspG [Acidobacteriota bacterium]|nr:type II secretion system protein GspG [Acidobacteriota bacterium]
MKLSKRTIAICGSILLLAPVAIIGAHDYRLAYQRGKQIRNMVDLRAVSMSLEAYNMDFHKFPRSNTVNDLKIYLVPKYIKDLPTVDSWGNELIYQSNGIDSYTVISLGKDHLPDPKPYVEGPISHFTEDMVITTGGLFVRFPEGT